MGTKNTIKAKNSAELLSYIINVTPELRENIDLPVQRTINSTNRKNNNE